MLPLNVDLTWARFEIAPLDNRTIAPRTELPNQEERLSSENQNLNAREMLYQLKVLHILVYQLKVGTRGCATFRFHFRIIVKLT